MLLANNKGNCDFLPYESDISKFLCPNAMFHLNQNGGSISFEVRALVYTIRQMLIDKLWDERVTWNAKYS